MSHRRFCEMKDDARYGAADEAVEWGYPREITNHEIEQSVWVRYGADCILWLNQIQPERAMIHLCIRADARARFDHRRLATGIEVIAELLGIQHIDALVTLHPRREAIARALQRLGWCDTTAGGLPSRDLRGA